MGKPVVLLAAALGLLRIMDTVVAQENSAPPAQTAALVAASPDSTTAAAANRIVGYTAWDDDFLYIAFQINKPTLNGKNTAPYSNPLEDDAVILSIQTDNDRTATQPTPQTFFIAVSGMGGIQLYSGAEEKPLFKSFEDISTQLEVIGKTETDPEKQAALRAALLARLLKFQVTPKGASRVTGTTVPGYTVELAIPWVNLGGRPNPETKFGFHVAVQSTTPDSPALQTLSSLVKSAQDLKNPSLWNEIVFLNTSAAPAENRIASPRILGAKPNIDGALEESEWLPLAGFEFGERALTNRTGVTTTLAARVRPDFKPQPPRPAVARVSKSAPLILPDRKPQRVAPLTLARYLLDYQGDTRLLARPEGVWKENGATALANHPLEGTGPWFSYMRADWHRRQLIEVRRAGVDAIVAAYRPLPNPLSASASRADSQGLLALASALNSLKQAGQEYPQVALYLDTSGFMGAQPSLPDLNEAAAREALYAAIRDFFIHIPAPFHLTVPLSKENGGRRACVVFLSTASAFQNVDARFVADLRGRFAQDFAHADLILIGASDFKGKASLDGYFTETKAKGFQFEGDGWVKIASVGAGYDASLINSEAERRPRKGVETYREDWTAALDRRPDWVLLDGWNDYARGAAIAPTVEAGYGPADLTRVYTRLFAGLAKRGVKFLWHDAPAALLTNRDYAINARAQNTGIEGWDTNGAAGMLPVGIAYRWRKDGQVAATGNAPDFAAPVPAGENVTVTLSVKTQGLAPGDYVLEIGAAQVDRNGKVTSWVSSAEDGSLLEIPVRVSDKASEALPEWAATLVSSDAPLTPETGSVYEVRALLRNDGATAWRKSERARVTARLFQAFRTAASGEAARPEKPVWIADATAMLESDVLPGQAASVRLKLPMMDSEGKPLPISDAKGDWAYALCWEIASDANGAGTVLSANRDARAETAVGVLAAPQIVHIADFDFGVRFLTDGTPASLPGQRRQPVRLGLQNVGAQTWKKDQVRVGYHWYYLDGTEFLWEDETTPLPEDVPPGKSLSDMLAWVTPPPFDGTYYLVWDVKVGDTWASTTDSARVFNESVRAVQVIGGKLVFADLTKLYNVDGVSDEDNLTDGDFDGKGRTFPATLLPPFTDAPIAPALLWQPAAGSGPDSPRRISFRLGPKGPKANNFIACKGQRIDLGKSAAQCKTLHILAASSGQDISTNLRLIFQEPTRESEDLLAFSVHKWDSPPARPEQEGYTVRRIHTPQGSTAASAGLHHYVITVREPRKLTALQLPNAPDIKIAALTLEK